MPFTPNIGELQYNLAFKGFFKKRWDGTGGVYLLMAPRGTDKKICFKVMEDGTLRKTTAEETPEFGDVIKLVNPLKFIVPVTRKVEKRGAVCSR